jgi:competence CoiA-like predicted nuclease
MLPESFFKSARRSHRHRRIQRWLQHLVGVDEVEIEVVFRSIHRVADLCWPKEHLVLEVQCSHIELSEVQSRIAQYKQVGYSTLWFLDDRLFNQRHLFASELYLRNQGIAYFVSLINSKFNVYDQVEIIQHQIRFLSSSPFPIDLRYPYRHCPTFPIQGPSTLIHRWERALIYFQGDTLDKALHSYKNHFLQGWADKEKNLCRQRNKRPFQRSGWNLWIERYKDILEQLYLYFAKD